VDTLVPEAVLPQQRRPQGRHCRGGAETVDRSLEIPRARSYARGRSIEGGGEVMRSLGKSGGGQHRERWFPDAAILCRLDTASRSRPPLGAAPRPLTPHPASEFGPLSGNQLGVNNEDRFSSRALVGMTRYSGWFLREPLNRWGHPEIRTRCAAERMMDWVSGSLQRPARIEGFLGASSPNTQASHQGA